MHAQNVKSIARSFPLIGPSRLFHTISPLGAEAAGAAPARKANQRQDAPPKSPHHPPSRYHKKPRLPPTEPHKIMADIITGNVISRAASKATPMEWKHSFKKNADERRMVASLVTKKSVPKIPSAEMRKFFRPDDLTVDIEDDSLDMWSTLKPGAFVELRRNDLVAHGVVLESMVLEGVRRIICLVSFGEVWSNLPDDILFTVPNFVDVPIVTRCGSEIIAADEHQVAARVQVLKKIRALDKQIEQEFFKVAGHLQTAYKTFRAPDPEAWSQVTTMQVARLVAGGRDPSLLTLITVHKHLMRRSDHFVALVANFRALNVFWVRPQSQVDELRAVEELIRNGAKIDEFVAKAKEIIANTRETTAATWSELPSQRPASGPAFTTEDALIIRFLQHSIRTKRSIQSDPYIVPTAVIMKKLGLYPGTVGDDMVCRFLVELGVHAPWHDPVTSEQDMEFLKHGGALELALPRITRSASQIHQALGPDDLYPNDIVESIRHDFGDLPVYVIDDLGAQELDDGLSIEPIPFEPGSHWVHVHVADPTAVLPPTHRLAQQALHQSSSFYFVHDTIPMLPPLPGVTGLGSSRETGEPEKVMSFSFKVNQRGEIGDYFVRPGIVRNVQLLKYDDVDLMLGVSMPYGGYSFPFGGESTRSFTPTQFSPTATKDLKSLDQIARKLTQQRLDMGVVSSNNTYAEISTHDTPFPPNPSLTQRLVSTGFPKMTYAVGAVKHSENGARRLVAECMKVAARISSRFFRDRGIPAMRRAAGKVIATDEDYAQLVAERDEDGYVPHTTTIRLNAAYPKAEYTLGPRGHWQLGVPEGEGYCRVTSPLRRFGDIVAHWQIKHALLYPYAKPLFDEEWMKGFCVDSAVRDQRLRKLTKAHNHGWALTFISRWMEYPDAHRDVEDPLQSLIGYRIGPVRLNTVDSCYMAQAQLPQLGIRVLMTGLTMADSVEIGEPITVEVKSIRQGLKPLIWVTKKR